MGGIILETLFSGLKLVSEVGSESDEGLFVSMGDANAGERPEEQVSF